MYWRCWFIEVNTFPLFFFISLLLLVCLLTLFFFSSSSSAWANQATPPWQPSARVKHPQMVLSRASSRRTTRSSVGVCVCLCVCERQRGRDPLWWEASRVVTRRKSRRVQKKVSRGGGVSVGGKERKKLLHLPQRTGGKLPESKY